LNRAEGAALNFEQATARQIHSKAPWIVEACKRHGYRYTPRLHIDLYGNRRGR